MDIWQNSVATLTSLVLSLSSSPTSSLSESLLSSGAVHLQRNFGVCESSQGSDGINVREVAVGIGAESIMAKC